MTTNTNGASVTITETSQIEGQDVQQSTSVELDALSAQGAVEATAQSGATTPSADEVCFNIAQDGTVIIGKPAAGVSQALEANAAQKYIFNVSTDEIKSAVADGKDLVLTFDNGSTVRIENYMTEIASGEDATLNFMNGQTVTLASLFPADVEPAAGEEEPVQSELRDPQPLIEERAENTQSAEQVAKVEPAAGEDVAQQLAQIEPAAGEAGAGAAGGNSGFGFNSSFRAQGVIPLNDVGPIDPTALEYGLQRPNDDLYYLEREEELAALNPLLEVDNAQVLEDGSVVILIDAVPESGNSIMVITITGIPNTWTVTGPGTYDPVTETWTITTTPGVPFVGGPTLTPPADSDVDLPGLIVTVRETDTSTGQTGTSTTTIDVIVDAVADTPEVDGLDDSGREGETLDIEIPTALTGEEVNAGGIGLDDGSESITSIVIAPVDPSVDLNDFTITNVNGPVTLDANGHIVLNGRDDLVGLTITPRNPNFVGSIDLQITLNTQENPNDAEFNGGNDTNSATDTITLTWRPVANPPEVEVDPRNPNGNIDDALVLEDGTAVVDVRGTLDPAGSGDEILSLTVTGIDLTKLEGGEAGFVASNGPNGEVWVRVPGSPDTAASYTITLTTPNTNYTGTFTFTPAADSDRDIIDMSVTASAYEPATGTTATSAPDDFNVIVDAVADTPEVDGLDDSGVEGETLDIEIPTALTGEEVNAGGIGLDDGSESITSIVIAPVDPSVDLNDYVITNVNGPVTLDANGHIVLNGRDDLVGLTITPRDPNFVGSIDLQITLNTQENPSDTEFDGGNDTNSATDTITLTWRPVANPPEVEVDPRNPNGNIDDALVLEDGTAVVDVRGTLDPAGSGDEILSLTVTGIDLTKLEGGEAGFVASNGPNGEVWVRVPGSPDTAASYTITLTTPNTNYTGTFTFTPAADSDRDIIDMSVTASAYEPATGTTATSAPDDFNVIVDAVADTPEVDGLDDSGVEGATLDIEIPTALTGEEVNAGGIGLDDGSESITSIVIAPVDPSVDLNDYIITNVNGPVTLDANGHIVLNGRDDLVGLTITPKDPQFSGSIQLDITLNTQENPNDTEFNGGNDTNSATDTITLTWAPTINPPFVKVNNGQDDAFVKEDHSIDVPVVANLATGANAAEYLTLTVTGINLTRLEGGADGFEATGQNGAQWVRVAGSPDTAASYTITLPAGVNYTGSFTFTPAAQSDLDISGMRVTATATDPSVSPAISASSGDNFNVIVDAVADTPSVRADDNAGEEGDSLAVNIDGLLGVDNDGSESITGYEVRGNQAEMVNFTFTVNGVERTPVNGVISLTPAEVDALVVTPKDSTFVGSINLTGVVLSADTPSDREFDTSDNTSSARDPFTLTWNDDDQPIITQPEKVTVDETNLTGMPRNTSASGRIDVDFGDDAAGARIEGNNVYNIGGATSNGNPIGVSYNAANGTYTGTAGGNTVFTLVIENDGDYTFTLRDTIDHPVAGSSASAHNDAVNFTFGFTARDSDGDTANGLITVRVLDDGPVAHDDYVAFGEAAGSADGNVITGAGNTNTTGADNVSEDGPNTIAAVNGVTIAASGTTSVTGTYGVLRIAADGSYTYTLNRDVPHDTVARETFTYTLKDGDGDISQANLKFEVTAKPNDVPTDLVTQKLIVDETDVMGQAPFGTDSATGTATANFGGDGPGTFQVGNPANFTFFGGKNGALTSNGVAVQVTVEGDKYVGKAGNTKVFELQINSDGEYTFTLHKPLDHNNPNSANEGMDLYFEVRAVDADGDAASGQIRVYVQDDAPIANKDVNNFAFNVVEKDYNIVLVLDVSGSMAGNKLALLKSSIGNLLSEYNAYQNGDIKVHIVPFATSTKTVATFTVTNDTEFNNAIKFVNGMTANGSTNYEAPLQSAISWLQGASSNDPIPGADTYTYFVSDGQPNRYINQSGAVTVGTASEAMQEIRGTSPTDKVSEVDILKDLNTEVISVGIGVNSSTLTRLGVIDSDGEALDVKKAEDLSAILLENNPVVGGKTAGNVITGEGNDNTGGADTLSLDASNFVTIVNGVAIARDGTTTVNGTYGKLVIAADGSYTYTLNPSVNKDVQERFNYTLTDADGDSSSSSLHINATVATSGNFAMKSMAAYAAHDDLYGTEGADTLVALSDHTTMTGGAGADTFVFGADSRENVITDYDAGEGDALDISAILSGYDELTDMLEDFVFINKTGSDTQVFVDAGGSGNIAAATLLVTLEGVDVTLNDLNINTNNNSVV